MKSTMDDKGNPVLRTGPDEALRRACATLGLDASGARMLHHYSNAVFVLPAIGAVARITSGRDALDRVSRTQTVTRWLIEDHDFPATQPLAGTAPIAVDSATVVSFWVYYAQPDPPPPATSAHLGELLLQLHNVGPSPMALTSWTPLISLETTVQDPYLSRAVTDTERGWLLARIGEVREELAGLDWPLGHGLIHGDAWAGNLLWRTARGNDHCILGDWDWVSDGPREVDLVPTWHAALRYGKGPAWISQFVSSYGYDLAGWGGYRPLMAMRDLMQITGPLRRANDDARYRDSLRQRLDGVRRAGLDATWVAL